MSTEELTQLIAASRGHQKQAGKEYTKGSGRASIPSDEPIRLGASLTVKVVEPTGVLVGATNGTDDGKQAGVVAAKLPASEGVPFELKSPPSTGGSGDGGSETVDGSMGISAFYTSQILTVIPFNKRMRRVNLDVTSARNRWKDDPFRSATRPRNM